jgi:hypothetical protein
VTAIRPSARRAAIAGPIRTSRRAAPWYSTRDGDALTPAAAEYVRMAPATLAARGPPCVISNSHRAYAWSQCRTPPWRQRLVVFSL